MSILMSSILNVADVKKVAIFLLRDRNIILFTVKLLIIAMTLSCSIQDDIYVKHGHKIN